VQRSTSMLLVFNKNKQISLLTVAIIITISLSFLPLDNEGHASAIFPFSAEPVFAQLSGQVIPYGEDQLPTIPTSSSSSSSPMDLGLFMDSFANSIFNGTSTFAGVGASIVDGVEVSGITLDKIQNQLSVTLSHTPTQVGGGNNNITSPDTTVPASTIPTSNSVSIIAMRIPISASDILSIAASSSLSSSSSTSLDGGIGDNTTENQLSSFTSDSLNPFSLLSSLQIGSSTLTEVDWSEPQTVSMDLIGSSITIREQEQQLNSANATKADFVLVSVIPYTGVGNNTTSSTT
jgi:hypothetical protein